MTPNSYFLIGIYSCLSQSWEANDGSLRKHMFLFSCCYGTLLFFTVSTRASHWILTWATLTQCTSSKSVYISSILISSTRLHLLLLNSLLLFDFKPKCRKNFSSLMRSIRSTNLIVLDFISLTIFGAGQQLWRSSLRNSLLPLVTPLSLCFL
jgi:hypothetical protein